MRTIRYLVVHTAAFSGRNCDAEMIRRWHTDPKPQGNGWSDIGYHVVILNDRHDSKKDGTVERGRPEERPGAHVFGLNDISLGLCFVGDHDEDILTDAQTLQAVEVLTDWVERFDLPFTAIIGHHQVNELVDAGELPEDCRTAKTCPGRNISVPMLRGMVLHTWIRRSPGQGRWLYP